MSITIGYRIPYLSSDTVDPASALATTSQWETKTVLRLFHLKAKGDTSPKVGHVKMRYRCQAKNTAQLHTLGSHDEAVDEQIFATPVLDPYRKDLLPYHGGGPALEAFVYALLLAVALGQITPACIGAQHPQQGVDEKPVVCAALRPGSPALPSSRSCRRLHWASRGSHWLGAELALDDPKQVLQLGPDAGLHKFELVHDRTHG